MLLTSLLLVAVQGDLGPVILPGMNPYFHQAVLKVEGYLAKKDFVGAAKAVRMLPSNQVRLEWDDAKVPEADKEDFESARDRAIGQFRTILKKLEFEIVKKGGDIKITFVGTIPKQGDAPLPPGAAFMFSEGPDDPRVEGVIALKRGNPLQPSSASDVQNEVQYAIGSYFGLTSARVGSTIMARMDMPRESPNRFSLYDGNLSATAIRIGDQLRDAISKKKVLQPAIPQIRMSTATLTPPDAVQGQQVPMSVQVTNTGNAPLVLKMLPDCSCVSVTPGFQLEAGDTGLIRINIDTTDFPGDLSKHVIVLSNDAERPVLEIPIRLMVAYRYQFISPVGDTILMQDGGVDAEIYLVVPADRPMGIREARIDGIPTDLTFEPWQGKLTDPDEKDPTPIDRRGYLFKLRMGDVLPPGRASATLIVQTDDKQFPELRYNISTQKGIVAVPSMVYMGELSGPRKYDFLVSRPRVNFEITRIESDTKQFSASIAPIKEKDRWEQKVTLIYDGKGTPGKLEAMLTLYTNDPKQPKILVPVRGSIR